MEKIARRLKRRTIQLEAAAEDFLAGKIYPEVEVNEILAERFDDHVFARRLLIEWGFLDRKPDGSGYWRSK